MMDIKDEIAEKIRREFRDVPQLAEHLIAKLKESETPEDFSDYCHRLARRISWVFDPDLYRPNWHSIYCECDECLRLEEEEYGGDES